MVLILAGLHWLKGFITTHFTEKRLNRQFYENILHRNNFRGNNFVPIWIYAAEMLANFRYDYNFQNYCENRRVHHSSGETQSCFYEKFCTKASMKSRLCTSIVTL